MDTIRIRVGKACEELEDAIEARRKHREEDEDTLEDFEHFMSKAGSALSEYREELPYHDAYNNALNRDNPRDALRALANICSYIHEEHGEEYDFDYSPGEAERVERVVSNLSE